MKKFLTITAALSLSLFAVACGEGDDHDHEGHSELSLEAEACEHMADGPATAVTAGTSEAEAANTSTADWMHKRVDITLSDDGNGGFWGFVTYEATEAAEYAFFTSGELTVQIDGVDAEATNAVAECTDVANELVFDLTVGEHVVFITSASATVSLVAEEKAGDHSDHADEDHADEDHADEDHSDE